MLYEVTTMTDKVKTVKQFSDNLYLINYNNILLNRLLMDELKKINCPKYIQLYSTDWKLSVENIENYIKEGFGFIYEYIDDPKQNMQRKAEGRYIGKKRVVFTKAKDPLTGIQGYRFVGFFIGDHYDENGTITYKRIDDKFRIIKKKDNTNEDDF